MELLQIPVYCTKSPWQVYEVPVHYYIDPADKNIPPKKTFFPHTCPFSDNSQICAECCLAITEMLKADKIENFNSPVYPDFSLLK